jgi:MFS family permease
MARHASVSAAMPPPVELSPAARRRALVLAVPEGVLYAGMVGFAEQWFIADAIRLGASALEQGLVVGLPLFVGALGPILVLRLLARGFSRKTLCVAFVVAQAMVLIGASALDLAGAQTPRLVIVCSSLYQVCGQGSSPAWASWYGDLVPMHMRGSYFARRTKAVQYAICAAMVVAGLILQLLEPRTFLGGGGTQAWWPEHAAPGRGFAILFAASATSRLLSATLLSFSPEPPFSGLATTTKVLQFLRTSRGSNAWRLVAAAAIFYLSVYVASPFFVPFMVESLHFTYLWLMAALALQIALKAALQKRFGAAIDRHGARAVWLLAALGCAIVPVPFIWAYGPAWVFASQGFSGIAWGCFEVSLFVLLLDFTFRATRPHAVAAQSVMNGLGQLVGSLLGAAFLAMTNRSYRWLFVVSFFLRVGCSAMLPGLVRSRGAAAGTGARALLLRVVGLAPSGGLAQGIEMAGERKPARSRVDATPDASASYGAREHE